MSFSPFMGNLHLVLPALNFSINFNNSAKSKIDDVLLEHFLLFEFFVGTLLPPSCLKVIGGGG